MHEGVIVSLRTCGAAPLPRAYQPRQHRINICEQAGRAGRHGHNGTLHLTRQALPLPERERATARRVL